MSSLGLPGPLNTPPGDAALHRSWNRFLDIHNLRIIFHTSPAHIDQQCASVLVALRVPTDRRAAIGDSILSIWDRIGLVVDCLPADVNPHWRAEEQLLKPTALRLASRRARLAMEKEQREKCWDPMPLTLDMSVPSEPETSKEEGNTLRVATSLVNTEYFLGHDPRDPIFSYEHSPLFHPADERNFTYRGRVPRDPREDLLRLRLILPKVLAQLVVILAFSPEKVSVFPVECSELMDEVDDLEDEVLWRIQLYWKAKFGRRPTAGTAAYAHFLRSSALVREFAWLVHRACFDQTHHQSLEETRRARGLWKVLLPVINVLTSDRTADGSACEALLHIAKLHVEDEGRQARDVVFKEEQYNRALVYREGAVINKSIHALYASYTGRFHPTAGALFYPTAHPLLPRDPDLDPDDTDSSSVPIPDEVLAAHDNIRSRFELPPEAETDSPTPELRPKPAIAAPRKRKLEEKEKDTSSAEQEPPRKSTRRRRPILETHHRPSLP
ncbi:uncharacterized protein ColSpa_00507 [Colletotrichum spaethianum]|uniref:Uncharacterized protein n=1 Tax=Colletotrichum spaethianum TaxID=700344 RepID=A0AA37P456_9PEZI|nr:uncharacterized protein ColSpa_00507 [Colletotrichum spaethianum]GKT40326.1 hypothetical protein ColSpa_00507 [Colletotrichum spaethianum]